MENAAIRRLSWVKKGVECALAGRRELEIVSAPSAAEQARIIRAPVGSKAEGTVLVCCSHGDAHCPRRGGGISNDCITLSFNSCISFFSLLLCLNGHLTETLPSWLVHQEPGSTSPGLLPPLSPSPRSLTHTYPDRHLDSQHSTAGHDSHQNNIRSRRRSRLRLNITGSIIPARLSG